MAKNRNPNDGHLDGAVSGRIQHYNPKTGLWVKQNTGTGRFVGVKSTGGPFKGVRRGK